MIEHPDWLPPVGKEELLPHYRLGDDKGRIYRIVPENFAERKPWPFTDNQVSTLVAAINSTNDWQRDKAQQQLLWNVMRPLYHCLRSWPSKAPLRKPRSSAGHVIVPAGVIDR